METTWNFDLPKFSPLEKDETADVCIVGGGLAGFWCAYLLSKAGKKVIVLEKDKLGEASTAYTTAFITEVIDTSYTTLRRMFGEEKARRAWQASRDALQMVTTLVEENKIDCDFERTPLYSFAQNESELREIREDHYFLTRAGFPNVFIEEPMKGFKNIAALEFPNQAKYHPMKFLATLIALSKKAGVKIYENSEVIEVTHSRAFVKGGREVRAKDIVVATYDPLNNPKPLHFKKGMYVSYIYELQIPKGRLTEALFEDRQNPYHFFRIDDLGDKQRMLIGGEDHRKELRFEESKSFRALRRYIDDTFLDLDYRVVNRWQGDILEPSDGLPLIGKYDRGEYVAAAFSGNGMTYAALTGKVISGLILEGKSPYLDLYDPKRKMESKALVYKFRDYAEEFFGGAVRNLFK